jgi:hypothetical protein
VGFEIKLTYHPRKEEGGYNYEIREETTVKVGRPFDSTPLERLAGVIMSQMARRDIFVLAEEIEVTELVRSTLSFKECKDGKGIVLKNKKFSFNEAAQLVAEDMGSPDVSQLQHSQQQPHEMVDIPPGRHPHEMVLAPQSSFEDLYANPNKRVPLQKNPNRPPVNQNKVIYKVYLEPDSPYRFEVKKLAAKFSYDKEYPVHAVIPSPTGRLDAQKLAITDDTGKVVEIDEKYFTSVGLGLVADAELRFSGPAGRNSRRPKLAFENEMYMDGADPRMARSIPHGIPLDDGSIPDELKVIPDIRANKLRVS